MDMEPVIGSAELVAQRDFLRKLARGLLGDDALAEDVAQEVQVRALSRTPSPASPSRASAGLDGWFATVTRRLALNALRARSRRTSHERAAARPEASPSHEEVLDGIDLQRRVLEAVRELREPYRSAIWLRYYE